MSPALTVSPAAWVLSVSVPQKEDRRRNTGSRCPRTRKEGFVCPEEGKENTKNSRQMRVAAGHVADVKGYHVAKPFRRSRPTCITTEYSATRGVDLNGLFRRVPPRGLSGLGTKTLPNELGIPVLHIVIPLVHALVRAEQHGPI